MWVSAPHRALIQARAASICKAPALRRSLASTPPGAPVARGGGAVQGSGPSAEPEAWRSDEEKYWEMHRLPGGRQPQRDFKMGPYHHTFRKDPETGKLTPVGTFFVSPRKDPVTFVGMIIMTGVTIWTISQLSWGESFFEKRRRVIREKIRQEYGLPKGWEHEIEDDVELPLSDVQPGPALAAGGTSMRRQ
mmetsp:Transcript_49807/g.115642  ORF Transcript_49807/g.115642 Transcript_49807/m.115642 type:complete len:191 (+) Transcript_49807:29-601(+)